MGSGQPKRCRSRCLVTAVQREQSGRERNSRNYEMRQKREIGDFRGASSVLGLGMGFGVRRQAKRDALWIGNGTAEQPSYGPATRAGVVSRMARIRNGIGTAKAVPRPLALSPQSKGNSRNSRATDPPRGQAWFHGWHGFDPLIVGSDPYNPGSIRSRMDFDGGGAAQPRISSSCGVGTSGDRAGRSRLSKRSGPAEPDCFENTFIDAALADRDKTGFRGLAMLRRMR
jgi:hypothetical protein